ncbi:MAG: hypothetical protein HUJ24_07040 [Rhodobacteraceae bacterium]|nr:hypothetical protein [Paracoccaceae bacterium]
MALFTFNSAVDFRAELGAIDGLSEADVDGVVYDELFGLPVSLTTTFADFGSPGTTLDVVYNYLTDTTSFTVYGGTEYQFVMLGEYDIAGGFALEAGIAGISGTEPDYISIDPGSVIRAFGTRDEMLGEGRLFGGGGGDKIELEQALPGGDGLGAATRSTALGGNCGDILKAAVVLATLKGQGGDDTLVAEFGKVNMIGGNGADDFIVDNGFWDGFGTVEQAAERTRATIRDFDGTEDAFVFASVDDTMSAGDAPARQSLEDLFGAGTLATLANFTDDGLTHRFRENAAGDAVLVRKGTDGDGDTYDERVTFKGQGLADIDRADVFLQDYHADTYEFF